MPLFPIPKIAVLFPKVVRHSELLIKTFLELQLSLNERNTRKLKITIMIIICISCTHLTMLMYLTANIQNRSLSSYSMLNQIKENNQKINENKLNRIIFETYQN